MKRLFLVLTIVFAFIIAWPQHNYYPQLSQGDHGRDLYSAQAVLRGELPYKDFWWVYGPLMPYYYALFYKIGGGTIVGFLVGKIVLKVACAAFFYLAASSVMPAFAAFLAAMWFNQSQQDFFFTFNHIGGIAAELAILWLLFSYIQQRQMRFLWACLPVAVVYCLVKINFGLVSVAVIVLTAALTDWLQRNPWNDEKKKWYFSAIVMAPAAVALVYWLLLKDLPFYAVRQCMPYFGDDQPHHFPPSMTIPYYFQQHLLTFMHKPLDTFMGVILHGSTLAVIALFYLKKIQGEDRRRLVLCLAVLGAFFVLNFHEFVVSGVWYRTYWSLPFLFLFHFLMMSTAFAFLPMLLRRLLWSVFAVIFFIGGLAAFFSVGEQKTPARFLQGPHAKVYVSNEPQWTETVNAVDTFLNRQLKPGELFFALPYDDIYYYLAGLPSPTRQLIFFDHIKIPPEQEVEIIKELQSKNVQYVIMSNRIASSETGLGIFGKTYCPLISQYIAENFSPHTRQGGDWQAEPGWGHNHGVMIFKKRSVLP